jgi:dihydroflavonol-4-reductase
LAFPAISKNTEAVAFVTGGTGLVGSYLLRALSAAGIQTKALFREASGEDLPDVKWVQGALHDPVLLQREFAIVTHVFHCAGLVSFAPQDARKLYYVNAEGTATVVNACLQQPHQPKLCHVSSVAAIGKIPGRKVFDEECRWEPTQEHSRYAVSKHWAEVEVWRGIAEGLKAVIVNPSVILGGRDWSRSSTRLLKYAAGEHRYFTDGTVNLVDVRDVVEVLLQLAFSEIEAERFILNAGILSHQELLSQAANCFGKRPPDKRLSPKLALALARVEHVRSLLTGARPFITPDVARRKSDFEYDSAKVKRQLNFSFRPLNQTISWACAEVGEKLPD